MKTRLTILALLLSFISILGLHAQPELFGGKTIPLKPQSPLFGKDIVINDEPDQNRQVVRICSALNGWLFAVYSYNDSDNQAALTILKSTDAGINWIQLFDASVGVISSIIPNIAIVA